METIGFREVFIPETNETGVAIFGIPGTATTNLGRRFDTDRGENPLMSVYTASEAVLVRVEDHPGDVLDIGVVVVDGHRRAIGDRLFDTDFYLSREAAEWEYDHPRNGVKSTYNSNGILTSKSYYTSGVLDRDSGPAFESRTLKIWYRKGARHRNPTQGPAFEWVGTRVEYWNNGKLHRENGPAVEWDNGRQEWWKNGVLDRDSGPAVTTSSRPHSEYWHSGVHTVK